MGRDFLPIKIASPVRLAVVAPGKPWPIALISSDDEVSDLLGFYSIRESGLGLSEYDRPKGNILDLILKNYGLGSVSRPRFGVTDLWEGNDEGLPDNQKRRLFSIVFDLKDAPAAVSPRFFNDNDDLRATLNKIASSYRHGDSEELLYQSHILSAYLGQQISFEESRYQALIRTNIAFLILLGMAAVIFAVLELYRA